MFGLEAQSLTNDCQLRRAIDAGCAVRVQLVMRSVFTGATDVTNRLSATVHCYRFPELFAILVCVGSRLLVCG